MIAPQPRFAPRLLMALATLATLTPFGRAQTATAEADTAESATGLKTVAVAGLSSRDELLKDLDFLGELGGRPGLSGVITFFSGGALDVLEEGRPIGVVLQTDGASFTPLGCLPVTDIDRVLEVAENFGFEPLALDDDTYEIELPDQTIFFKSAGEWVFVAQSAAALASAPADPTQTLNKLTETYDLGVTASVPNVPEMYRQIALEELRNGMEEGLVQEEEESDEDFQARRDLAESQIDQLADMIQGLDQVTIGWSIDSEGRRTFLDAIITGLPDSDIALAMSVYDRSTSGVSGFHRPEAAASMLTTGTTPPELLEKQAAQVDATVEMLRTQAEKGIEEADELPDDPAFREALHSATDDLIDAYGDMLRNGRIEMGGSLNLEGDGFDLIFGAYVTDPSKIESAFKKLAAAAETQAGDKWPGIEWGYADHAGVKLHGMSIPVPDEGQAREALGETLRVLMGVGDERVYLAAGPRGEEALKRAIDDSAGLENKEILPAEIIVSLGQVLAAAEKVSGDNPQAAAVIGMLVESLEEAPEGSDRLVMTTEAIENGVKVRYLIEGGVLEAIGKVAAQAAAMQQQGGGGF
ncbi:hypothetical protein MalM25_32130 [Planctomycetes bacterium MalM25]|nr:hypothetical protein MalM25_32130 [Planctomycetes bacterium MalM25]